MNTVNNDAFINRHPATIIPTFVPVIRPDNTCKPLSPNSIAQSESSVITQNNRMGNPFNYNQITSSVPVLNSISQENKPPILSTYQANPQFPQINTLPVFSQNTDDNGFMPKQPVKSRFKMDTIEVGNFDEKGELIIGTSINTKTGAFRYIKRKADESYDIGNNGSFKGTGNDRFVIKYKSKTYGDYNAGLNAYPSDEYRSVSVEPMANNNFKEYESIRFFQGGGGGIRGVAVGKIKDDKFAEGELINMGNEIGKINSVHHGIFENKDGKIPVLKEGTKIYGNTIMNGSFNESQNSYVRISAGEVMLYNNNTKVYKNQEITPQIKSSNFNEQPSKKLKSKPN